MTAPHVALLFCIYSVLGWMLDTAFRTSQARTYTRGGFSPLPFSPVYGFAALLATALSPYVTPLPLLAELGAYTLVMGAFEYASGVVVVAALGKRLWNYRDTRWNIDGHTAPQYALAWGAISLAIVYVLNPFFRSWF